MLTFSEVLCRVTLCATIVGHSKQEQEQELSTLTTFSPSMEQELSTLITFSFFPRAGIINVDHIPSFLEQELTTVNTLLLPRAGNTSLRNITLFIRRKDTSLRIVLSSRRRDTHLRIVLLFPLEGGIPLRRVSPVLPEKGGSLCAEPPLFSQGGYY